MMKGHQTGISLEQDGDDLTLPLVAEQAVVGKERVETGRVRVTSHVEARRELIRQALEHDDVVVERVEVGQVVSAAPEIRMEGDVLVYPIVEEVLVVEKRLVLKEELRITRQRRVETVEREIVLRSVHADVERTPADPA